MLLLKLNRYSLVLFTLLFIVLSSSCLRLHRLLIFFLIWHLFFLLLFAICRLVLVHPGRIVLFLLLWLVSIRINALLLQISSSLLLSHDICIIHSLRLSSRSTLFVTLIMLGSSGLRTRPIYISLISTSHFICKLFNKYS